MRQVAREQRGADSGAAAVHARRLAVRLGAATRAWNVFGRVGACARRRRLLVVVTGSGL